MKIVDIADEIYRELGEPTDNSIPPIAFWIRTNLGTLNNYLNTAFKIQKPTLEVEQTVVDPDTGDATEVLIDEKAASILKKMYFVHNYEKLLRTNISAASADTIIEVSDQGSRVKKINKNEVTRVYAQLKSTEQKELRESINDYKVHGASPKQVVGDDTVAGVYSTSDQFNRISLTY